MAVLTPHGDGAEGGVDHLLVVNAGSSSLKLALLDGADAVVASGDLAPWDGDADAAAEAVAGFVADAPPVAAVGHRVVHGGTDHTEPVRIDEAVRSRLAELTPLAPLHQPRALAGIDAAARALPGVPAVACFDTAFHATIPPAAATYALPEAWRRRWPLRRFGFHGLSHRYAARRAAQLLGRDQRELRTVTCHLGAGASLAAVAGGVSVDTTMGFTPLDGLVMATRSGSLDPGLVLWLVETGGLGVAEVAAALEHESGLAGLAGTADMRQVRRAAERGEERARLALAVHRHRLRREIAAMVAALGGLDALVFTGGVGEHDPRTRAEAASGLAYLGVDVDGGRNDAAVDGEDVDISAPGAAVATLVVTAREELEIAAQLRSLLATAAPR